MNTGVARYACKEAFAGLGINPLLAGITDRAFGIGPEWKYINLKWHLGFRLPFRAAVRRPS
jgi:hypothetical protein